MHPLHTQLHTHSTIPPQHTPCTHRLPCHAALEVFEVEQLVLRSARKGRLRCYCIAAGVCYGQGEDDAILHPLFRSAPYHTGVVRALRPCMAMGSPVVHHVWPCAHPPL